MLKKVAVKKLGNQHGIRQGVIKRYAWQYLQTIGSASSFSLFVSGRANQFVAEQVKQDIYMIPSNEHYKVLKAQAAFVFSYELSNEEVEPVKLGDKTIYHVILTGKTQYEIISEISTNLLERGVYTPVLVKSIYAYKKKFKLEIIVI